MTYLYIILILPPPAFCITLFPTYEGPLEIIFEDFRARVRANLIEAQKSSKWRSRENAFLDDECVDWRLRGQLQNDRLD